MASKANSTENNLLIQKWNNLYLITYQTSTKCESFEGSINHAIGVIRSQFIWGLRSN